MDTPAPPSRSAVQRPVQGQSLLFMLPRFILGESDIAKGSLTFMTLLGGAAQGGVLFLAIQGMRGISGKEASLRWMALFLVALAVFVLVKRRAMNQTEAAAAAVVRRLRLRIADKVRKAELADFERITPSRYDLVLSGELQTIVEASKQLVSAAVACCTIVGGMVYIASVSWGAALATGGTFVLGILQFHRGNRTLSGILEQSTAAEASFLDRMRDLRDGFKELKVNAAKSDDLFDNYVVRSALVSERLKVDLGKVLNGNGIAMQAFFFLLVGVAVFVLPVLIGFERSTQLTLTSLLLFLVGPIFEVAFATQSSMRAAGAIRNLQQLEADLGRATFVPRERRDPTEAFGAFRELTLSRAGFRYEARGSDLPFGLKPVDLTVRNGDVLFLVGGNGSGKSTLIHLLCGLFRPSSGEVRVNGRRVDEHNLTAFRALFGIVLQDYCLFGRLYGNPKPDLSEANRLLQELDLSNKTSIRPDGEISRTDLSGGQRKRLAMVMTRLDDPPIFVFDEWAADQDPAYKKYFYEEMLPRLSAMGKTVIVVSHDDRYFPADYRGVYKMEDGELRPYCIPPGSRRATDEILAAE